MKKFRFALKDGSSIAMRTFKGGHVHFIGAGGSRLEIPK
jgi:hypothetical protein